MKPTNWVTLVTLGGVGAGVLWSIEWVLVSRGLPAVIPPVSWSLGLWLIAAVIVALAWPIRTRSQTQGSAGLLDPFYATRVLLLAKASSLTGAVLSGAALGVVLFVATRPVVSDSSLWLGVAAMLGAIVLVVAGLVAEKWCTLPPDSTDTEGIALPEGEPG